MAIINTKSLAVQDVSCVLWLQIATKLELNVCRSRLRAEIFKLLEQKRGRKAPR